MPPHSNDRYGLSRFLEAQAGSYAQALRELQAGDKRSHWMWFVFPQFEGLGISPTAQRYAIKSAAEAHDYLLHPVLGTRLIECTETVLGLNGRSALEIFGRPDDLKLCSCMTLFELVAGADSPFAAVLDKYFAGRRDAKTLELVRLATENRP